MMSLRLTKPLKLLTFSLLLTACTIVTKHQLDQRFGEEAVVERTLIASANASENDVATEFFQDVKPIVDKRCVVCHGCYDAPCQLKMTSFESIDRGASKEKVYDGTRLLAANLTRLSVDAGSIKEWREEGFFPVLNERRQTAQANREGSVMYRMLQLKKAHPLPSGQILPDSYDFSLNRDQQCVKIENFDEFAQDQPLWGMPFGLPGLAPEEQQVLERWIEQGAKARFPGIKPTRYADAIDDWEVFFNGDSLKQQLMARYIYEHLFLANLYFDNNAGHTGESREFYKLVRSRTPPGSAIDIIATRRPFDDPGGKFFYRLQRVKTTLLAKQHMPYALNDDRKKRWQALFLKPDYEVKSLPGYEAEKAANPFATFIDLPIKSRYQFMLDEAQFTIMGFIKGPVCRGQVALNVINDHFWVLFLDPEQMDGGVADFLAQEREHLNLPASQESSPLIGVANWLRYSKHERKYMQAKKQELGKRFDQGLRLSLDTLWDGEGYNNNAALTIFRHYDSATVSKGLVGNTPKTAWVIGYPLLERIHYLLVAGFDVFGNVGHQLLTRLYMDFLRMEGEYHFLLFLPQEVAVQELEYWYRGEQDDVELYINDLNKRQFETTEIPFKTSAPKKELFDLVKKHFGTTVIANDPIHDPQSGSKQPGYRIELQKLAALRGEMLEPLPEQSLLRLTLSNGNTRLVSLVRNRSHSNVAQLFGEQRRLIPEEQTLTVVEGVVGAYPNAFFDVAESQLEDFVGRVANMQSEEHYRQLLSFYGIRRTHPDFWAFSDAVHDYYLNQHPIEAGYLDYNRLENR